MAIDELGSRWDDAYAQGETTRSWFETEPTMSLSMIDRAGVTLQGSVVDVGGGTSRLVDALLTRGHADVTVLDLSQSALDLTRHRLGPSADRVHWVNADVSSWSPDRAFDLWHDRAALHFQTSARGQDGYRRALSSGSRPGTVAVFGCFAPDGPTHCSGLPVIRRDVGDLADFLGPQWSLVAEDRESHLTPGGAVQPFVWAAFVRRGVP